jgi:hypothetical protein
MTREQLDEVLRPENLTTPHRLKSVIQITPGDPT